MDLSQLIEDYLEHLVVEKNRSLRTVIAYRHYLERYADFCGNALPPSAITLEQVRKYRLHLAQILDEHGQPLSVNTQSYHLIALRSLLKYAARREITTLEAAKIELPKITRTEVGVLSAEELVTLLETPETASMVGLRDRTIMELLFSTGLRVSELCNLDRRQVSASTGELRVIGKGRKERLVFISERAAMWLEEYFSRRSDPNPAAFVGYRGKDVGDIPSEKAELNATRLTPRSVDRLIQRHTATAAITKNVTPHTLRHSFATDLMQN